MLSSDLFISKSIMTGRTNYWSTLLMCYLQQWGIIIRWRGCWDFKLDRLNPWMWNRDVNLFPSPLQHEPWGKTDRTLERRPSPLPFFFFFSSHRKLPWTSFGLSEIFQFFHSWTSNLQYFLFLSNFFLLDNTLKGGDQVRGGFSSQNIPTPLKTIQKALLLFCLSLTTVVIKSVK